MTKKSKSFLKYTLRIIIGIILVVMGLLFLVVAALNLPPSQKLIKNKLEAFVNEKSDHKLRIGDIDINWINSIDLNSVYVSDNDADTLIYVGYLGVRISLIPLLNQTIYVNKLKVENSLVHMFQAKNDSLTNLAHFLKVFQTNKPDTTTAKAWNIKASRIIVNDIRYILDNRHDNSLITTNLKNLLIKNLQFPTDSMIFNVNRFDLDGLSVFMSSEKSHEKDTTSTQTDDAMRLRPSFWVKNLNIANVAFHMKSRDSDMKVNLAKFKGIKSHVDLGAQFISSNKLLVDGISFKMVSSSTDTIATEDSKTAEKSHFDGFPWKANVQLLELHNSDIAMITENKPTTKFNPLDLSNLNVKIKDIKIDSNLVVADIENIDFKRDGLQVQKFAAELHFGEKNGSVKNLVLESQNSIIHTSLDLQYPSFPLTSSINQEYIKNIFLDLSITETNISKQLITYFVDITGLSLPDKVQISSKLKGSMNNASGNINLYTPNGNILADIDFKRSVNPQTYIAKAKIKTEQLELGAFLTSTDSVGALTATVDIDGTFTDAKTHKATFEAVLDAISFRNYNYKNLKLKGSIENRYIVAKASMKDKNLDFKLDAIANLGNAITDADLKLKVNYINPQELNFTPNPLAASFDVNATLHRTSDTLKINVVLPQTNMRTKDNNFSINSFSLNMLSVKENSNLTIQSDLFDAEIKGNMAIDTLVKGASAIVASYFSKDQDTIAPFNGKISYAIDFKNMSKLTRALVPELTSYNISNFSGSLDGTTGKLNANGAITSIRYSNFYADSVRYNIYTDEDTLKINFALKGLKSDSLTFDDYTVSAHVFDGQMFAGLHAQNPNTNTTVLRVNSFLNSTDSGFYVAILPNNFILNYSPWDIDTSNYLLFGKNKFVADFKASSGNQSLKIQTKDSVSHFTRISLNKFEIENLTSLVFHDTSLVSGIINGKIELPAKGNEGILNATIQLKNLVFKKDTIDLIAAKVIQKSGSDKMEFEVSMGELPAYLNAKGILNTKDTTNGLSAKVDIKSFYLHRISPYLSSVVKNLDGYLNGDLTVKGSIKSPEISGNLNFKEVSGIVNAIGMHVNLENENISFDNTGIKFNDFRVKDKNGNSGVLTGMINTTNYKNFKFNLNFKASDLRIINIDENPADQQPYYGTLIIDADADIKGDLANPVVEAKLVINSETNFTYALSGKAKTISDEGVVVFVEYDIDASDTLSLAKRMKEATAKSGIKSLDLSVGLEIEDNTHLNLIINPVTKDRVEAIMNANLTFQMNEVGTMNLTGKAEISGGNYYLTVVNVSRKFDIMKNSSVVFNGNPTKPELNIRAKYTTRTAPIGLFSDNELPGDNTSNSTFKQRIPFSVIVELHGQITDPSLSFDVSIPKEYEGMMNGRVAAKVQQISSNESERNKQALSLLVFGTFIGGSGSGLSVKTVDYRDQFISEALNAAAERFVKFVDMDINIESFDNYGNSGENNLRTEANVKLAKRLLNKRLELKAGGAFVLQGDESEQDQSFWNKVSPQLNVNYYVDKNNRIVIKGFSVTEYTGLLDGNVRETGLTLEYNKDFNYFKNFFKKEDNEFKWENENENNGKDESIQE